jgi:hypothetical protein
VVYLEVYRVVYLANGKRRAAHNVRAAGTAGEAAGECRLATAKITDKLNRLTALQRAADLFGDPLGSVGTGGIYS